MRLAERKKSRHEIVDGQNILDLMLKEWTAYDLLKIFSLKLVGWLNFSSPWLGPVVDVLS